MAAGEHYEHSREAISEGCRIRRFARIGTVLPQLAAPASIRIAITAREVLGLRGFFLNGFRLYVFDSVVDRLESIVVGLQSRARRQGDDQVHMGFEQDMIAGFALRCINGKGPIGRDIDVHEDIERCGNLIRRDAIGFERMSQIAKAALMRIFITVNDAKRIFRAGRQQEIMTADRILDDLQHDIGTV